MTMKVRVIRVWELDTEEDPLEVASRTAATRDVVIPEPEGFPWHYAEHYTQPINVLNSAWDLYMDQYMSQALEAKNGDDAYRLPTMAELLMSPVQLSMLFDLAITAYREHHES